MFRRSYGTSTPATSAGTRLEVPEGDLYAWRRVDLRAASRPYFEGMTPRAGAARRRSRGARVLALLGDSVTTDHISPAGSIRPDSPAGKYLIEHGVEPQATSTPTARGAATTR